MIRIAIVEDDDSYIRALTGYLEQYGEQLSLSFHTTIFHDGLDIVTDYKADYDIILMDIQMKHLDGMTTAEKIRKLDDDVSFIFITSTVSFAVQGYLVDALGYEKGYSKCHNAYLIHLMHVTGIVQNNVILSDSTTLPVSRAKKKAFLEALTDYMGGVTR